MDQPTKDKIIKWMDARTQELRDRVGDGTGTEQTEKIKALMGACEGFGCQSGAVWRAVSAFTGFAMLSAQEDEHFSHTSVLPGTVITVLGDAWNHSYPIGKSCVARIKDLSEMLTTDDTGEEYIGNSMLGNLQFLRPATLEEITKLVDDLGDKIHNHFILVQ